MKTVAVIFVLVLAGCSGKGPTASLSSSGALDDDLPSLFIGAGTANGSEPLFFEGKPLGAGDYETWPFRVEVPAGYWQRNRGGLEVSIAWDYRGSPLLAMRVLDASGGIIVQSGEGARFARTLLLGNISTGDYSVEVRGLQGRTDYRGVLQIEVRPPPVPALDLLPNIVTLPPTELRIGDAPLAPFVSLEGSINGCKPYEAVEYQARRCLRFNNAIGNAGQGAFHARLMPVELGSSVAGQGHWVQRIWRTDGSFRDVQSGLAEFHPTHAHIHYAGMAEFRLFRYDWENQTRQSEVAQGRKTGFVFGDYGLVALGLPGTRQGGHCTALPDDAARVPFLGGLWRTCLSPNWFDLYDWTLDDQFIEVTGVPDGTYELVSRGNVAGAIVETQRDDNAASAIFRLEMDKVRMLGSRTGLAE